MGRPRAEEKKDYATEYIELLKEKIKLLEDKISELKQKVSNSNSNLSLSSISQFQYIRPQRYESMFRDTTTNLPAEAPDGSKSYEGLTLTKGLTLTRMTWNTLKAMGFSDNELDLLSSR